MALRGFTSSGAARARLDVLVMAVRVLRGLPPFTALRTLLRVLALLAVLAASGGSARGVAVRAAWLVAGWCTFCAYDLVQYLASH